MHKSTIPLDLNFQNKRIKYFFCEFISIGPIVPNYADQIVVHGKMK